MENKIIGSDSIIIFDFKPESIKSKIDTGAETSSIHCPEAFIKNGDLHCKLLDHPEVITFKNYKIKNVKSSNGLKNKRYCVKLKFTLGDESFESDFTLNNRDKMKYPVLLGKKFLDDNKFLVDVSKPYSETVKEGYHIRTFTNGVDNDELVWHRDREDRIVKSVGHTDWMVQLDNELPKPLTETIYIPKNTYHRVIKGNGDLTVKIKKILKEDFEWVGDKPLKGYIITVNSYATGAKFFVDEEGGLSGYIGNDWREGIFSREDDNMPKIFRTKAEANKMVSAIKQWRPYYLYGDSYDIRKL